MSDPPRRRWWIGTLAMLGTLVVVLFLPALVLTLGWPDGNAGNLLFFTPQYVFPLSQTFVGNHPLPLGLVVDGVAWLLIAIGFGFLTRRLARWLAACVGLGTILVATVAFHMVILKGLGWNFLVDGP
jgi:hypothetical protein